MSIELLKILLEKREEKRQNGENPLDIVIDLPQANLEGADLEGANLEGANLEGANLIGAIIVDVNFKHANLTDAHLERSNLYNIDFTDATLIRTNLSDSLHDYAEGRDYTYFKNADLTGANLHNYVNDYEVSFEDANLTGAILSNNRYYGKSSFKNANLTNANLSNLHYESFDPEISGANFTNVDLTNINIPEIIYTYIEDYGEEEDFVFVFPIFTGTIYENLQEEDFLDFLEHPVAPETPVAPIAPGFEIHVAFEKFAPIQNKYFEIINQPEIDLENRDIYNFITYEFSKSIGKLFPNEEASTKIKEFIKLLNKIKDSIPRHQNQLIAKSINFVFTQKDDDFKREYIKTFLDESCNAYTGSGDNTSCVKGIIERFVTSVGKAAEIVCIEGSCENPTYKALDKLMNPKFYIEEEASNWFKMAETSQEIKDLSPRERKQRFINDLIERANELDNYSPAIEEKINAYANEIDYSFTNLQVGGKKRKTVKRKKSMKRKKSKTMKKRKTKKYVKRKKTMKSRKIKIST